MGEKVSFTGVENERVQDEVEACSERAVARLEKRVSDMFVEGGEKQSERKGSPQSPNSCECVLAGPEFPRLAHWHWRGVRRSTQQDQSSSPIYTRLPFCRSSTTPSLSPVTNDILDKHLDSSLAGSWSAPACTASLPIN